MFIAESFEAVNFGHCYWNRKFESFFVTIVSRIVPCSLARPMKSKVSVVAKEFTVAVIAADCVGANAAVVKDARVARIGTFINVATVAIDIEIETIRAGAFKCSRQIVTFKVDSTVVGSGCAFINVGTVSLVF